MEEIKVTAYSQEYETKEEEERSVQELVEGLLRLRRTKKDKTA